MHENDNEDDKTCAFSSEIDWAKLTRIPLSGVIRNNEQIVEQRKELDNPFT